MPCSINGHERGRAAPWRTTLVRRRLTRRRLTQWRLTRLRLTRGRAQVRAQGTARVDALTQIKACKRDNYRLEWDNRRADMEIEDREEAGRSMQLLRLPKNYEQLLTQTPEAAAAEEVAALLRPISPNPEPHIPQPLNPEPQPCTPTPNPRP